jgi:hypothetical protein
MLKFTVCVHPLELNSIPRVDGDERGAGRREPLDEVNRVLDRVEQPNLDEHRHLCNQAKRPQNTRPVNLEVD